MRRASSLGLALLLATACGPDSGVRFGDSTEYPDRDRDGALDANDCAPDDPALCSVQMLYADRDGDRHGAGPATAVCTAGDGLVPAGWSAVDDDCDDSDPAAFKVWAGYADDDADGVGSGEWLNLCGGAAPPRPLPALAGDCAPDDATRWQELAYLHRDADGDRITVPREGVVCTGAQLPAGYASVPAGVDCDDASAAVSLTVAGYADADGDGVGAGARATFCTAGELPAGYVAADGDCAPDDPSARVTVGYAYRDADLDGRTVPQAGTLCVASGLPAGYRTVENGYDCDDADAAVWGLRSGLADTDGDGHGAGQTVELCSGAALPAGWVAPGGEPDCAPDDPHAWQSWSYTYRDADGDSYTVRSPGTLCIGDVSPAGYANTAKGNDCDDATPSVWATVFGYADSDLDGAGAGPSITSCTDGALPAGQVARGGDCAADDPTRWQVLSYGFIDADRDGFTAPAAGQVCTGATLPDPYRTSAVGQDCDDANPSVRIALVRYPDVDGDGVGATPRRIFCVADGSEPAGYSRFGWDVDDRDPAVQWDGFDGELVELGLL